MKKYNWLIILLIVLGLILTGCSINERNQADTNDETVFSPPEVQEGIPGIWSASFDELTQNNYFYGDGKLVSITQDSEEETWCTLAYWSEEDNKIELSDKKNYKYNTNNGKWAEEDTSIGIDSIEKVSDTELNITEILPDGDQVSAKSSKNEKDIQIPGEADITLIINDFTIH